MAGAFPPARVQAGGSLGGFQPDQMYRPVTLRCAHRCETIPTSIQKAVRGKSDRFGSTRNGSVLSSRGSAYDLVRTGYRTRILEWHQGRNDGFRSASPVRR